MKSSLKLASRLACVCLFSHSAQAQLLGPFTVHVGAGVEHDSNVLRTPESERRSDDVASVSIGIRGDKQYGLQRFRVNAEGTRHQYSRLSALDYSTVNYSLAWDWQVTPRFQGVLSADRRQYRDVSRYRDLSDDESESPAGAGGRTDRTELFEARYLIDGPWRALGGVSRTSSRSRDPQRDLDAAWDASPSTTSVHAGAAHEFASGTLMALRLRRGEGEYREVPTTVNSPDFRENEVSLDLKWPVTAKTALDARLAYLERNHSASPSLNFSGPVGYATVSWDVGAKTRLIAGVASDLYSYQATTPGYVRSNRIFLKPVWKPTAKTSVTLRYVRENRNWRGAPAGSLESGRNDVSQWAIATFEWEPRDNIMLSASARAERRNSDVPVYRYRTTTLGGSVRVNFCRRRQPPWSACVTTRWPRPAGWT